MINCLRVKQVSIVFALLFAYLSSAGHIFAENAAISNVEGLMLKDAYAQAARDCQKLLTTKRGVATRAKLYYLLGICLLKQDRFVEARKNFSIVIQRYSQSRFCDDASLGIGDAYFLAGDYEQAQNRYNKFVRDYPQSGLVSIARMHLEECQGAGNDTNSYFSVQLGCFSSKENAQKLRDDLINRGFQAYILALPSESFYRVRVGKFDNRLEAEFMEQRLKGQGYSTKVCP